MTKKSDNAQGGLVCTCINDLLLTKSEFITTGVPPNVLESKVIEELSADSVDVDEEKLEEKAKLLIATEVKNETLVRMASGNYFHGPKVNQQSIQDSPSSNKNDSQKMTNSGDDSESAMSIEDEEEEEEEEDIKYRGQKKDEDYQPQRYPKVTVSTGRSEGRVSSRMKKSRFDSDEYVFPSILKKISKNIAKRSESTAVVEERPPKKKRGPKPKLSVTGHVCSICGNVALASALSTACKSCGGKAHTFCAEKELKGDSVADWHCAGCKPLKWKCCVCLNPSGKEFGVLVSCESCSSKYHRPCHSPPIETKSKPWRCVNCPSNKSPGRGGKRPSEKLDTDSESTNQPTPKRLSMKPKSDVQSEASTNSTQDSIVMDLDEDFKPEKKTDDASKAWWRTRLRPIVLGKEQPPLGPIPDLSVPDVSKWSCVDVENYFNDYFLEKQVGQVFADQDIDGKALKLMRRSDVVSVFDSSGFKMNTILDVLQHVKRLQLRVNDRRYIWADIF